MKEKELRNEINSRNKLFLVMKNPSFAIGLIMIAIILFCAIFAKQIAPIGYDTIDIGSKLKGPGYQNNGVMYLMGTDHIGRDLFARVIYGSRIALKVGLIAILIEMAIGITMGLVSGYYGGFIDKIIMFITDITWAMPPIILALAIVTVIGPGLENVIIAIAIVSWAQFARIIRAKTQTLKNMPFIEAARAIGESDFSIIVRYILPNTLSTIIIIATLALPNAILSASALGFLGLGTQPPTPDWGVILSEAVPYVSNAPWISIFPGIALVATILSFNFIGEGLRDILDPKLKA